MVDAGFPACGWKRAAAREAAADTMADTADATGTRGRPWSRALALEVTPAAELTTALKALRLLEQPGMLTEARQIAATAAKAADQLLMTRQARLDVARRMAARSAVKERRWRAARLVLPEGPALLRRASRHVEARGRKEAASTAAAASTPPS